MQNYLVKSNRSELSAGLIWDNTKVIRKNVLLFDKFYLPAFEFYRNVLLFRNVLDKANLLNNRVETEITLQEFDLLYDRGIIQPLPLNLGDIDNFLNDVTENYEGITSLEIMHLKNFRNLISDLEFKKNEISKLCTENNVGATELLYEKLIAFILSYHTYEFAPLLRIFAAISNLAHKDIILPSYGQRLNILSSGKKNTKIIRVSIRNIPTFRDDLELAKVIDSRQQTRVKMREILNWCEKLLLSEFDKNELEEEIESLVSFQNRKNNSYDKNKLQIYFRVEKNIAKELNGEEYFSKKKAFSVKTQHVELLNIEKREKKIDALMLGLPAL